jgi:tetratricopeptide (TPR) repeat protein
VRRLTILFLIPAIIIFSASVSLADQFDSAWKNRHSAENAGHAVQIAEKIMSENPSSYESAWKLAMAYSFYGEYFTKSSEEKLQVFEKGEKITEKAVQLNPQGVEGLYWHGIILGQWGQANGIMKSLYMVKPMKEALEKIIKIKPEYDEGGAYAILGRLYFITPEAISIGNKEKAYQYLKNAYNIAKKNKLNLLYLAEILMERGKYKNALKLLENAVKYPIDEKNRTEESKLLADIKKDIELCREKLLQK